MTIAHPESGILFSYLGGAQEFFENFGDAALNYKIAAEKEADPVIRVRRLGRAAAALARGGSPENVVDGVVDEMRSIAKLDGSIEDEILDAIRQLAEIRKDDVTVIAVMQRMMEINPGDTRTRFSLAY